MEDDARLRLEYEQTVAVLRDLTETRFRLLALVPTIAGAAVGLLTGGRAAVELLAIGLLGLTATFGLLVYELSAGELKSELAARARQLESELFTHGPLVRGGGRRLLGVLPVSHRRGVAFVFGAALAGWSYIVAWGALRALSVSHPRDLGLVIGVAVGAAVFAEVERLEAGREAPVRSARRPAAQA